MQSEGERNRRDWIQLANIVWVCWLAALFQLRHPLSDGAREEVKMDFNSIPLVWFAVASDDKSDMLTTSDVTEFLARAKGKRTFITFGLHHPSRGKISKAILTKIFSATVHLL